jgi:tagaturonate reductase
MDADKPRTILQFGTGKFLRAFADLFVHETNQSGTTATRVVVVQSTGSQRAAQFNAAAGRYHVAIRGLEDGREVDRMVEVASVNRALTAQSQWREVLEAARAPSLAAIVSNVTEAGYALEPDDAGARLSPAGKLAACPTVCDATDGPPRSFPAKLLAALAARFEAGQPGVTILPCELLQQNGQRLRQLVLEQAARWKMPEPFVDWLQGACAWRSTLVDRIVSAPRADDPMAARDPLFAVAEPFALWLVEGIQNVPVFGGHPAVQSVETMEPYYLRKVRILNGAHTALVAKARPLGFETVRQAVLDPEIGRWLERLLFDEIVPTLEGRTDRPEQFARQCLERFANPFLEHRLADIAMAHETKLRTRLVPTYEDFRSRFGRTPKLLGEIIPGWPIGAFHQTRAERG